MIHLPDISPGEEILAGLDKLQARVDQQPDFPSQVEAAATLWRSQTKAIERHPVLGPARATLKRIASAPERCGWCEDSAPNQIDHVLPKRHYPDRSFGWLNLLYACGVCNTPKGSRAAVLQDGALVHLPQSRPPSPPPPGQPALLNPRVEDPMAFLELDLPGTFLFAPTEGLSADDSARAQYTLDLLQLNDREALVEQRRNTYRHIFNTLEAYKARRDEGAPAEVLARITASLRGFRHRTVWLEMKRQRTWIPELRELFAAVPEALEWEPR